MRYLGVDFGTKKIGLATSDESGCMAFPYTVVPNNASLIDTVVRLLEELSIDAVVVGHSMNLHAKPNAVQRHIDSFVEDLTLASGIPIYLEPEQYTTQAAKRIQGTTAHTDASAAALILDSYLTKTQQNSSST
jgi:putative Holliday junction resolvase